MTEFEKKKHDNGNQDEELKFPGRIQYREIETSESKPNVEALSEEQALEAIEAIRSSDLRGISFGKYPGKLPSSESAIAKSDPNREEK